MNISLDTLHFMFVIYCVGLCVGVLINLIIYFRDDAFDDEVALALAITVNLFWPVAIPMFISALFLLLLFNIKNMNYDWIKTNPLFRFYVKNNEQNHIR